MPGLICIWSGLAWKHWPEAGLMILAHWLAPWSCPFGQNLTQSARTKWDPGWFYIIWSRPSDPESRKLVVGWLHSARTRSSDFCTPAFFWTRGVSQNPTRTSRSGLGCFCTVWSGPSFEEWKQIGCMWEIGSGIYPIQPKSGCILAVMAITGRNPNISKSDPARLLGLGSWSREEMKRVCAFVIHLAANEEKQHWANILFSVWATLMTRLQG